MHATLYPVGVIKVHERNGSKEEEDNEEASRPWVNFEEESWKMSGGEHKMVVDNKPSEEVVTTRTTTSIPSGARYPLDHPFSLQENIISSGTICIKKNIID